MEGGWALNGYSFWVWSTSPRIWTHDQYEVVNKSKSRPSLLSSWFLEFVWISFFIFTLKILKRSQPPPPNYVHYLVYIGKYYLSICRQALGSSVQRTTWTFKVKPSLLKILGVEKKWRPATLVLWCFLERDVVNAHKFWRL